MAGSIIVACRRMAAVEGMAAVRVTAKLATPVPGVETLVKPVPYDTPALVRRSHCTRSHRLAVVALEVKDRPSGTTESVDGGR